MIKLKKMRSDQRDVFLTINANTNIQSRVFPNPAEDLNSPDVF